MGIITLEDVIEELIQEEIIDETDVFVDVQKRIRVARAKAARRVSCPPELGESNVSVCIHYSTSVLASQCIIQVSQS